MTNKIELKEEIHKINGLIGRIGFTVDELYNLQENEEEITKENLDELQTSFDELKSYWKIVCSRL